MSDCGYSIQNLCASRGITLNIPKQKGNDQFMEVNVATILILQQLASMLNDL